MKLEEMVGKRMTEAQFDEAAGEKDACYRKVKARYDVWPSAYASGALVKCRKVGAANWGNKSKKESMDEMSEPMYKITYQDSTGRKKTDIMRAKNSNLAKRDFSASNKGRGFKILKVVKEGTTQKFKSSVIDKAVKIAKSMGGNMTAAVKKIEKIEKNLSKNGRVEYALQQANEGLGDKFSKRLSKYNKKNKKSRDAMKKYAKVKKVKLRGKSGMGKISHLGMESVDEGKYEVYFDMGSPGLMSKSVVAKDKKEAAKKVASGLSGKFKIKKVVKESVDEARGTCWVGYQQKGMKDKGGKMVPNCVKEITEIYYEVDGKGYGYTFEHINDGKLNEAEYQGRKVKLGKPMQGDTKKFKVYVKNPKGNVVKVNFGQGGGAKGGTMKIRKSNPGARKSFRARHNCDSPGPRHKARYWSCRKW